MIHSISVWNFSPSPNYVTNVDMTYPYSEVPYIGNYKLVKIPISTSNVIVPNSELVDHIDYWGEGRINAQEGGSTGFPNCYNVNHQYQQVSNGPDRDRKIPNRIPVISYTNCDTSSYIKDNSVKLVTLMGAPINKSCAKDIGRMVHSDIGKVVVYGFKSGAADIRNLEAELAKKNLLLCSGYRLPDLLKTITLFAEDDHRDYLNITDLAQELYQNVNEGRYEHAVNISKTLENSGNGASVAGIVSTLLKEGKRNTMAFGFKLWDQDEKDIVSNRFPTAFKHIFNQDEVKITNKNNLNVKLESNVDAANERSAFGTTEGGANVLWKFVALWENNKLYFKILNTDTEMFLRLGDGDGVKKSKGASSATESKSFWYLDPVKEDDDMLFFIVNQKYNQALKLEDNADSSGNKQLSGHIASESSPFTPHDYGWYISA